MKARWADPVCAKKQAASIRKPPNCPTCGESNIVNFYVDLLGRRTNKVCKECHKTKCKLRWHSRTLLDRWTSRCNKYGVTKEYLIELFEKQGGKCAICDEIPTTTRGLHIDHSHTTGKVRGLLCHGCNVGIGSLKDNIKILSKAIDYLES